VFKVGQTDLDVGFSVSSGFISKSVQN